MTLIASTSNYSYPIILGDILTSSNVKTDDFKLPTFLEGVEKYLPDNIDNYPARFVQKTYIIANNLAIAIAGNFDRNKEFVESIRLYFSANVCDRINLEKFINTFDRSKFEDTGYLLLLSERVDDDYIFKTYTIGNSWQSLENELYETVLAIGSGTSDFLKEINRQSEIYRYGEIDNEHDAITANIILLSGLLAIESISLETIKKYWGAGFELKYYDKKNNLFRKKDEFSYLIWRGKLNVAEKCFENLRPILVISYKYYNDVLVINTSTGDKYNGFGVLPIYTDRDTFDKNQIPQEFKVFDIETCNTLIIDLPNGEISTPTFSIKKEKDSHGDVSIKYSSEKGLEISFSQDIENKLLTDLLRIENDKA